MPSELDPLLPQNRTAPEISGYGFSKQTSIAYERQEESTEEPSRTAIATTFLSTICVLFTLLVSVALLIALTVPRALNSPNDDGSGDNSTVAARVEKILSETPLIGYN